MNDKTEDNILKIESLDCHYGDFQALYGVSMNVPRGRVVSIIGANGSGKSTLLNAIMGVNKPSAGKIVFEDTDITGKRTSEIVSLGLTISPEGSSVFEDMSVLENLLMGAWLKRPRKNKQANLEKVFELFPDLCEKKNQLATFLSGGQRQMLSIARAIMSEPKILICDEISLGLAPVVVKDLYRKIKEINDKGVTILLVEQEVKRSLGFSDYSYVMVKGRIVIEGVSKELPEAEVKDAYLGIHKYA